MRIPSSNSSDSDKKMPRFPASYLFLLTLAFLFQCKDNLQDAELVGDGWAFHWNTLLVEPTQLPGDELKDNTDLSMDTGCYLPFGGKNPPPSVKLCQGYRLTDRGKGILQGKEKGESVLSGHSWKEGDVWREGDSGIEIPVTNRGYAVYTWELDTTDPNLAFLSRTWYASNSLRVWQETPFGWKLLRSIGKPSSDPQITIETYAGGIIPLESYPRLRIALEVSNYQYRMGGITKDWILGNRYDLEKEFDFFLWREAFVAGSLVFVGFYHLLLFYLRGRLLSALFFGIFCLVIAGRVVITSRLLEEWLGVGGEHYWIYKTEYATLPLGVLLYALYFYNLFGRTPHPIPTYSVIAYSSIMTFFILSVDNYTMSKNLFLVQISVLLVIVYSLWILGKNFFSSNPIFRENSRYLSFVAVVFSSAVVWDILVSMGIISTVYLAGYGLLAFVIGQALVIARMNARHWANSEHLSERLSEEVDERTAELRLEKERAESNLRDLLESRKSLSRAERQATTTQLAVQIVRNMNAPLRRIESSMQPMESSFRSLEDSIVSATQGDPDAEDFANYSLQEIYKIRSVMLDQKLGKEKIAKTLGEIQALSEDSNSSTGFIQEVNLKFCLFEEFSRIGKSFPAFQTYGASKIPDLIDASEPSQIIDRSETNVNFDSNKLEIDENFPESFSTNPVIFQQVIRSIFVEYFQWRDWRKLKVSAFIMKNSEENSFLNMEFRGRVTPDFPIREIFSVLRKQSDRNSQSAGLPLAKEFLLARGGNITATLNRRNELDLQLLIPEKKEVPLESPTG